MGPATLPQSAQQRVALLMETVLRALGFAVREYLCICVLMCTSIRCHLNIYVQLHYFYKHHIHTKPRVCCNFYILIV